MVTKSLYMPIVNPTVTERVSGKATLELEGDPTEIVVCGDLHGNWKAGVAMVRQTGKLLRGEKNRLILQAGDFGVLSGYGDFLDRMQEALEEEGITLLFIDGNHDDHSVLPSSVSGTNAINPYFMAGNIRWLPRGYRFAIKGKTWLALGGAASVDRALRTEGIDWWPEEEITAVQAQAVIDQGHADVMLTHDCPIDVHHSFPLPPPQWDVRDLARSDRHRGVLQDVVNQVKPGYLIHGHLHFGYQRMVDFGYGDVQITGLNMDGEPYNYAVLNLETMEWRNS